MCWDVMCVENDLESWIVCTEVRYCVLCGDVCGKCCGELYWLYRSKELCVGK